LMCLSNLVLAEQFERGYLKVSRYKSRLRVRIIREVRKFSVICQRCMAVPDGANDRAAEM